MARGSLLSLNAARIEQVLAIASGEIQSGCRVVDPGCQYLIIHYPRSVKGPRCVPVSCSTCCDARVGMVHELPGCPCSSSNVTCEASLKFFPQGV